MYHWVVKGQQASAKKLHQLFPANEIALVDRYHQCRIGPAVTRTHGLILDGILTAS